MALSELCSSRLQRILRGRGHPGLFQDIERSEILTILNTSANNRWTGDMIVDFALSFSSPPWRMLYSNINRDNGELATRKIPQGMVQKIIGERMFGPVRVLPRTLEPMEIQILKKGD